MVRADTKSNLTHPWHRGSASNPPVNASGSLGPSWPERWLGVVGGIVVPVLGGGLRRLPEPLAYGVRRYIGWAQRRGMKARTLANMRLVLGEETRDPDGWLQLWNQYQRNTGSSIVEAVRFGRMSRDELLDRVRVSGEEHLRAALDRGNGAMLFLDHLGPIGAIPAAFGPRGYDISITGNKLAPPCVEKIVAGLYEYGGVKRILIGQQLPFKAARIFRRNGVLASFFDFTVVDRLNCWLPFGQADLCVNLGPALLALRNQAPVLCVSSRRESDHHFHVRIHPPLTAHHSTDRMANARAMTESALFRSSAELRLRPEDWWPWDYAQVRPTESESGGFTQPRASQ